MSITVDDVERIILVRRTIGGDTFYIDGQPMCFRPLTKNPDRFCTQDAGFGTDHTGTGACKFHRGSAGRPLVSGRYALVTKRKVRKFYEEFANDPNPLDLIPELVLLRSLLADEMTRFSAGDKLQTKHIAGMLMAISSIVERIERIQSNQVLTASAAKLMMTRAIDIARQFVPAEKFEEFLFSWRSDTVMRKALSVRTIDDLNKEEF